MTRFCEDDDGHEAEFAGRIVVCDRGVNGRVEKSENVAAQGAVGFVLVNDDDPRRLACSDDEYAAARRVHRLRRRRRRSGRGWPTGTDHVGAIAGTTFVVDDQYGDIMASFSSRGPNRAVDTIVPA